MRREKAGEDYRFATDGDFPIESLRPGGSGATPGYIGSSATQAGPYTH